MCSSVGGATVARRPVLSANGAWREVVCDVRGRGSGEGRGGEGRGGEGRGGEGRGGEGRGGERRGGEGRGSKRECDEQAS